MKNTADKNRGFIKMIAAALAAMTVMTAAVVGVSASSSEPVRKSSVSISAVKATESSKIAAGTVFGINDKIKLSNEYVVTDDLMGVSAQCISGEFRLDTDLIGFTMMGQFEFIGLFGEQDLRITTMDAASTRPCDVKGIKLVSGNGTENSPYRFAVVFN